MTALPTAVGDLRRGSVDAVDNEAGVGAYAVSAGLRVEGEEGVLDFLLTCEAVGLRGLDADEDILDAAGLLVETVGFLVLLPLREHVLVGDVDVGSCAQGLGGIYNVAGDGTIVVHSLCVKLIGGEQAGHEAVELLILHGLYHVGLGSGPCGFYLLADFGREAVFGGIVHGVVDGCAVGGAEAYLLRQGADKALSHHVGNGTGHGFGELGIRNGDAQTLVLLLKKLLDKKILDDTLTHAVVVELATLSLELLAELREACLIIVVVHLGSGGLGHGCSGAEVGAAGGKEVAENERKKCHDDNHEEQH